VKATILLCDAAQATDGKLSMLGAGWNVIGPQPAPFAIALLIDVPWDATDRSHHFDLTLDDADGRPVTPVGGDQPIAVAGDFNVSRPEGLREGSDLRMPLAITFGPLALPTGQRYVWHLDINGQRDESWVAPFDVRPG
jgi:hypothetical protein